MKNIITLIALFLIVGVGQSQDKEKRIKFNKGALKICTSSSMKITGYDGDEVIIKSLNDRAGYVYDLAYGLNSVSKKTDSGKVKSYRFLTNTSKEKELEKGLKPLGNKSANPADNLYLDITETSGELIIRDYNQSLSEKRNVGQSLGQSKLATTISSSFFTNNKYELLIPNSIKLFWNTEKCAKKNSNTFSIISDSKPWSLSNFKGEVEVSTLYNSITLTDVSGPVIANTIGGNIKMVFDKVAPNNFYSLISNDGYIDVTLPQNASINVDAHGSRILSDIDFKVLNDELIDGLKGMELRLNSGNSKMKLDAGTGNVYLRKG